MNKMDRVGLLQNKPSSSSGSCETDETEESSVVRALEGTSLNDGINEEEVFGLVFSVLDQHSLRQTRLVCRKWNDWALQILSKIPGRMELRFVNGNGINGKGSVEMKKLNSILRLTSYPEMFFSELVLKSGVLVQDLELLTLLQNYGSTVKSLELRGITLNLTILRPMLEDWLVNLDTLSLVRIRVNEDQENNITVHNFQISPTPLKLKLVGLRVVDRADRSKPHPNPAALNLSASIIKRSPELTILIVQIDGCQPDFWKSIQNIPEITMNLEHVWIEEVGYLYDMTNLSLINDVTFSNKLKYLTLCIMYPIFPQEHLLKFLEKVGESVENLRIFIHNFPNGVQAPLSEWKINLPVMNKLKHLDYDIFREASVDDSSAMDVLEKLPKLETLILTRWEDSLPSQTEFLDALISNSAYLSMYPHTGLKTLSITGLSLNPIGIENPGNILKINQMFPNLQTLTLEFQFESYENSESTKESWFIRILTGFYGMKNLKILDITFPKVFELKHAIKFEACLSPFEASKSLEEFPPGVEKVIVRSPELKVMGLQNYQMELSESIKLFKDLDEKGILLKALQNVL